MNEKLDKARVYVSNPGSFGNFTAYPLGSSVDGPLSEVALAFLVKNGWKRSNSSNDYGWRGHPIYQSLAYRDTKPELTVEELKSEGLSQFKAELCIFLIEYREPFKEIDYGDGCIWQKTEKWARHDFVDRFYVLAGHVFYNEPSLEADVQKAASELLDMLKNNTGVDMRYDFPQQRPIKQSIEDLEKILKSRASTLSEQSHASLISKTDTVDNTMREESHYQQQTPNQQQTSDTLDDKIIKAIITAQEKYARHYADSTQDSRGKNGLFSSIRHGTKGQSFAKNFADNISTMNPKEALYEMLAADNRRYHRHSFASYVLDEISKLAEMDGVTFQTSKGNIYNKQDVLEKLIEKGIVFNPNQNKLLRD